MSWMLSAFTTGSCGETHLEIGIVDVELIFYPPSLMAENTRAVINDHGYSSRFPTKIRQNRQIRG